MGTDASRSVLLAILATLAATPACEQPDRAVRVLRLVQARPANTTGIYLNERLVLHFSDELDPTSVTSASVRIAAADGSRARGELRVQGRRLEFWPEPVRATDLSDGGYAPGTKYEVRIAGFPRPDGVKSRSGAPLERTLSWSLETVEADGPREGFLFEDASPDEGRPLLLLRTAIGTGEPILFEGEEPIDPSTLHADDFVLRKWGGEGPELGPPIPLRARVLDNRDKRSGPPGGRTIVALEPIDSVLEAGAQYVLQVDESRLRLRDFGGHSVWVRNQGLDPRMVVRVIEPRPDDLVGASEHVEHFFGARFRSPVEVPGADGTAWWGDSGRVEVRYPAAAGSGRDGAVRLAGSEARRDVQATRLELGAGEVCELRPVPGPLILRAQGRLEVRGRLVRRRVPGNPQTPPTTDLFRPGETLSGWLGRAMREGITCTCLVAGGDLVVDGSIEIAEGPLLLVSGGRIRVLDVEGVEAPRIETLGLGGSRLPGAGPQEAPLVIDAPVSNPLVEPLTFAVRSGAIPPQGAAASWFASPRIGAHAGSGDFRVRYVGDCPRRGEVVVDDPSLLTGCPSLRLLIELEVRPGTSWDPPWIDFVALRWRPVAEGR